MSGFIFFYSFLHNTFGAYFGLRKGHTVAADKQEQSSLGSRWNGVCYEVIYFHLYHSFNRFTGINLSNDDRMPQPRAAAAGIFCYPGDGDGKEFLAGVATGIPVGYDA